MATQSAMVVPRYITELFGLVTIRIGARYSHADYTTGSKRCLTSKLPNQLPDDALDIAYLISKAAA